MGFRGVRFGFYENGLFPVHPAKIGLRIVYILIDYIANAASNEGGGVLR